VFRYEGGTKWVDCGQLPETEAVGGLVVFQGRLFASSLYKPAGFFRYEGGTKWSRLPDAIGPDYKTGELGPKRVVALTVHEGLLYATSYDGGRVYRFDGKTWTDCGQVGDSSNTQTYAFTSYEGTLHVATWRSGRVFRFEDVGRWTDIGRLGGELEVMGMMVHNGRFIAGSLPLAQTYAYDGNGKWSLWQRLDLTPDVEYRRAWTMAEHAGEVFCSTLPSGKIWAARHGRQVSWDHALPSGWHHIGKWPRASVSMPPGGTSTVRPRFGSPPVRTGPSMASFEICKSTNACLARLKSNPRPHSLLKNDFHALGQHHPHIALPLISHVTHHRH
jgi:hypothetical protein